MTSVCLRRWRADDASAVALMRSDPHVARWSSLPVVGAKRWIAEQRLAERGPSLAICVPDDDRALGKIALRMPGHASRATTCAAVRNSDHPVGELSYWLLPEARGRGLAGAAVRAMLAWVADRTDLRSAVLDIEIDNAPSIGLAERLGAERRGPERVEVDRAGIPRTMIVFVLRIGHPSPGDTEPRRSR